MNQSTVIIYENKKKTKMNEAIKNQLCGELVFFMGNYFSVSSSKMAD